MKKIALLSIIAISLTGCYRYTTHRTISPNGKTCKYELTKTGNMIFGYSDGPTSSEKRAEKDCAEWLNQ